MQVIASCLLTFFVLKVKEFVLNNFSRFFFCLFHTYMYYVIFVCVNNIIYLLMQITMKKMMKRKGLVGKGDMVDGDAIKKVIFNDMRA